MELNISDFPDYQTIGKDREDGSNVFIAPQRFSYLAVSGVRCVDALGNVSDNIHLCERAEAFRRALLRLGPAKSLLEQALEVADGW